MSTPKKSLTSKVAAGAALVALSGFVPQPFMQQANAASATINVNGTFISGITMTAGLDVLFGSMLATDTTGFVDLTAGAVKSKSKATFLGTPAAGTIAFKAAAGGLNVDVKATGFKKTAAAGAGAAGSFTFTKLYLTGPFAAGVTLTGGAATTSDSAVAKLNNTAGATAGTDINIGARVTWNTTKPIGTFSFPAAVTITY